MRWTVYHKGVVIRTIMPLSRSLVRLVDEPLDIFPHLGSHPEVRESNSAKIYYTYIASRYLVRSIARRNTSYCSD